MKSLVVDAAPLLRLPAHRSWMLPASRITLAEFKGKAVIVNLRGHPGARRALAGDADPGEAILRPAPVS